MHTNQRLDRLDDPLCIANEIAVDLLRRQVFDHWREQPREMQDLAGAHGSRQAVALPVPVVNLIGLTSEAESRNPSVL
jgi:hypothetical protein